LGVDSNDSEDMPPPFSGLNYMDRMRVGYIGGILRTVIIRNGVKERGERV
jgi:hypothetical protein